MGATGTASSVSYMGQSNGIRVFVRPLLSSWISVGTFATIDTIRSTYPSSSFEIGAAYNGDVQRGFYNGWNVGARFTLYPMYPMGDTATTLVFGTTIFVRGLNDLADKTSWFHLYYRFPSTPMGGNGVSGTTQIYVRPHLNAWQSAGQLSALDSIMGQYPPTANEYGIAYNGDIQTITATYWNTGTRVTLYPFFPMGDATNLLQFGTVVNVRGTQDVLPDTTNFWHRYYMMNTNGFTDSTGGGNGNVNTLTVFYRALKYPWVNAGNLGTFASVRAAYPNTMYELGTLYNSNMISPCFVNTWNQGQRLSLNPIYPMGDNGMSLQFGTTVFQYGLSGAPTSTDWYHAYYFYPNSFQFGNNGPNANSQPLYVRPYFHHIHSTAWGA